jgi:GNAT superfamily N-acetyltransferase
MRAAEVAAVEAGRTLLVLDTVTGSDAERLYTRLGWQRCGVIPKYALWPQGGYCSTTVFYRLLTPDPGQNQVGAEDVEVIGIDHKVASGWKPRLAREEDIPAIERLIPLSVQKLQAPYYSSAQIEAALGLIFAVDRQLIRDGTYFVVESNSIIVGSGGWSRRGSLYGGDQGRAGEDPLLDPQVDAARVRAFFVHPEWARRGIGRSMMMGCEKAIREAGFREVEIVATLAGEGLYASFRYEVVERYEIAMKDGLKLPVVRMKKALFPLHLPDHLG